MADFSAPFKQWFPHHDDQGGERLWLSDISHFRALFCERRYLRHTVPPPAATPICTRSTLHLVPARPLVRPTLATDHVSARRNQGRRCFSATA
jgi:hypothetical protein